MPAPGIIANLFKGKAKDLVKDVGGVIDKIVTNDEERLRAKKELGEVVLKNTTEMMSLQRDVLISELKGSWLQRSWRPIVMLAFAAIVVYNKGIAPMFDLPNEVLDTNFWSLLEIGMGGYIIGRTGEKIADKLTENVDLSMLKRKDRKLKKDE